MVFFKGHTKYGTTTTGSHGRNTTDLNSWTFHDNSPSLYSRPAWNARFPTKLNSVNNYKPTFQIYKYLHSFNPMLICTCTLDMPRDGYESTVPRNKTEATTLPSPKLDYIQEWLWLVINAGRHDNLTVTTACWLCFNVDSILLAKSFFSLFSANK